MSFFGISVRPAAALQKLLTHNPFLKSVPFVDENFVPIICNLRSIRKWIWFPINR